MRKQLPPNDIVWVTPQSGRPTEILYEYIKNLEGRSLGVPVSLTAPTSGQVYVYNSTTGLLEPATLFTAINASPANPTGTSSGTPVMMGMGGTCTLTPSRYSRIRFSWSGIYSSSGVFNTGLRFYYGTGTAPANGVAATGTQVGPTQAVSCPAAGQTIPFAMSIIITGLTPSTAYWFDIAANAGSGTSTLSAINFEAMEF